MACFPVPVPSPVPAQLLSCVCVCLAMHARMRPQATHEQSMRPAYKDTGRSNTHTHDRNVLCTHKCMRMRTSACTRERVHVYTPVLRSDVPQQQPRSRTQVGCVGRNLCG